MIPCVSFIIVDGLTDQMERLIPSIIQLIEDLDEKMQTVIREKTDYLTSLADAEGLLGSQENIKEYVNELIEEINSIKKNNKSGKTR
jgi:division protein CdvB (Snf7/Vps24/ESCRT-III family)